MRSPLLLTLVLALATGAAHGQDRDGLQRGGGGRQSGLQVRSRPRPTPQEEEARAQLRAEETLHRLRLARLTRLHAVAREQGWTEQFERLRLLALAEKERHFLERLRLRRRMRDELFWELEEELVVGRLRGEPQEELPLEMRPVLDDMFDSNGVRLPNRGPKTVHIERQNEERRKVREERRKRRAYERFMRHKRDQARNQAPLPDPNNRTGKIRRGGGKLKGADSSEGGR